MLEQSRRDAGPEPKGGIGTSLRTGTNDGAQPVQLTGRTHQALPINSQAAFFLIFGAVLGLIWLAIRASNKAEQTEEGKRRKFMEDFGFIETSPKKLVPSAGLPFGELLLSSLKEYRFWPFCLPVEPRITEILMRGQGTRVDMVVSFTTEVQERRELHEALIFQVPCALPHVSIQPQGLGQDLLDVAGMRDIQFESAEFNRRLRVLADDPQAAFEFLTPPMMELLMKRLSLSLQVGGTFLVFVLNNQKARDEYGKVSELVTEMLKLQPAYLIEATAEV